jgi:hypothetical protein
MNTESAVLRKNIETELQRRLSAFEWAHVVEEGFVNDLDVTGDIEKLTVEVIAALGAERQSRKPREKSTSTAREDLLSRMAAVVANKDRWVRGYRSKHLSNGLVPLDCLDEWLQNQQDQRPEASRIWSSMEIPPTNRFVSIDGKWVIDPPLSVGDVAPSSRTRTIEVTNPSVADGPTLRVDVNGFDAIHQLEPVAERLAQRFRWSTRDAAAFVLTGWVPRTERMRGTVSFNWQAPSLSTVQLSIDPDCSGKEVALFYAEMKAMMGNRGRGVGKGDKAVRLLNFVLDQGPVTYDALLNRWNAEAKEAEHFKHRSAVRQAVERAKRLILGPRHPGVGTNGILDAWEMMMGSEDTEN